MKIRPLLITTPNRISFLNNLHGTDIPLSVLNQVIFYLHNIPSDKIKMLSEIASNKVNGISVFKTSSETALLLIKRLDVTWPVDHGEIFTQLAAFTTDEEKPVWDLSGRKLDFNTGPIVMGILNVTPDSFSENGAFADKSCAIEHALEMAEEGAEIIDIGGESTRPGAEPVPEQIELGRVIPVIEEIRQHSKVLISIDTYKSKVAQAALEAGADIINDISGARFDKNMKNVARTFESPMIVMHIKGTPKQMQKNPTYADVVGEIYEYFSERISFLQNSGVSKLILDPGIGFGKRLIDNLIILRDLADFQFLNRPLLIGASRKSMIGQITGQSVDKRLSGSIAAHLYGLSSGAKILRVHDVREIVDAARIYSAIHDA